MDGKNSPNISVNISMATVLKTLLLLGLVWMLYYLSDLVLVVMSSVVIASALEPATVWLVKRRIPRLLAVILLYFAIFLIFISIVYFMLPQVMGDIVGFASNLPDYIDSVNQISFLSFNLKDSLSEAFPIESIFPDVSKMFASIGGGFLQTAGMFFGGIFSFVIMAVLSFYLSVQERGIENMLRLLAPERYEAYLIDLWNRAQRKIGLWMQGQLLLAFIMGVFVFMGLSILRLRYALILSLFAMVAELIPVFGPVLAGVPAVAIGFSESVTIGVVVLAFYIIVHQFENHLLYPLVVRKIVGVPPLLVILAIIVGGRLAGFLGVLLSVPLAAAGMEYISDIEKKKLSARGSFTFTG